MLRSRQLPDETKGSRQDIVERFLTFQMFWLIYFQKLGFGPAKAQVSVTMFVMLGSLVWMVAAGHIGISGKRVVVYLAFVGVSVMSQVIAYGSPSLPSMIEMIVLYSFMTVVAELPPDRYLHVLHRFVTLMILPACIIIFQFVFQKVTGLGNPISMNRMLPSWMLLQGSIYEAPYHWGFAFTRPNGFFFLETSYASAFAASATIIEATYFRRPLPLMLMIAATLLSLGGTGITMLVIAAPFLIMRLSPRAAGLITVAVAAALIAAYLMNVSLPLLSRVGELDKENSSGAGRILLPATYLLKALMDPSFLLTGTGAGSSSALDGSIWPLVKLAQEYGLLSMVLFSAFYLTGIAGNFNVPLKVALSITFNFTGGYLLSANMVQLLVLLCFIVVPEQPVQVRQTGPTRRLAGPKLAATP